MVLRPNIYSHNTHTPTHSIKITMLLNSGHPVATPARSFDNFFFVATKKNVRFDVNIPNINLNTSVVADITCGSKSEQR